MKLTKQAIGRRAVVAGLAGTLATPAIVRAQGTYPNKPVRYINPFPAGGATDTLSRIFCAKMAELSGQQWIVENKGGSGGNVGMDALAKSDADGYTLGLGGVASHAIAPTLYTKLPFNARTDFTFVSTMWWLPNMLVLNLEVPAKNVPELIELLKKNPGKYTFATAGVGSVNHLRGETLKLMAGIDLLHVPYRGVGEALPDLLAGNVSTMFDANVFAHARGGKLRLLAVLQDTRYSEFPEVATMKEQGLPDYDVPVWYGAYAPAGVPRPILEKLRTEIATIHTDKEFQARQFAGGIHVYPENMSLEQLKVKIETQSRYFADLIKRANIKLES